MSSYPKSTIRLYYRPDNKTNIILRSRLAGHGPGLAGEKSKIIVLSANWRIEQ